MIGTICFANDIPYPNGIISATLSPKMRSVRQESEMISAVGRRRRYALGLVRFGSVVVVVVFMLPFQRNAIDKNLWDV